MENSNKQNLFMGLVGVVVLIAVIFKAATYPNSRILETYDAEVISVSLVWRGGKAFNCDLRLDTGLVITMPCLETFKNGDKVIVAKVQSRGSEYVIQEFVK